MMDAFDVDVFDQPPAKPRAWARPWAVTAPLARKALRLGAWYPVVEDDREHGRVTLVIRNRNVRVPARLLELQKARPHRFTVVRLAPGERNPLSGSRRDLGRLYGVCPASGHRVRLGAGQTHAVCSGCGYRGEVGWNETG
jgi:hypothetical protein